MSTYLSLLRIAFWMLPIQRICTVVGLCVMAGLAGTVLDPTPLSYTLTIFGCLIALAPSLLLGGTLWRALSAPRVVSLAPRGRMRLFLAVLGIVISLPVPVIVLAGLRIGLTISWQEVWTSAGPVAASAAVAASVAPPLTAFLSLAAAWLFTIFIASRSPLAMLLALLSWVFGAYAAWKIDFEYPGLFKHGSLSEQVRNIALPLLAWTLFGAWYLRARRIRPPGWLLPGGQSVLGAVALTDIATAGIGQRAALERLALGGASVSRLLLQWSAVFGLLLLLLRLLVWQDEANAQIVAHVAFVALILSPAVVAGQSAAIVQRARSLWLLSGYSRRELFAFTERTLLKFAVGMALLFAAFLLVLWFTQPWRPLLTLPHALAAIVVPGLLVAVLALFRPGGPVFYWPMALAFLWGIAWRPLTSVETVAWSDSSITWNGTVGWQWTAAAAAAVLVLRLLAPRRWQAGDLPRAAASL